MHGSMGGGRKPAPVGQPARRQAPPAYPTQPPRGPHARQSRWVDRGAGHDPDHLAQDPDDRAKNSIRNTRILDRGPRKADVQKQGRERARKHKVEHIIQKADGTIAERDSYGGDSPRRGG